MPDGRKIRWTESSSTIAPQIRADGVHIWPFDPSFPVAVTFQVFGDRQPVRLKTTCSLASASAHAKIQGRTEPESAAWPGNQATHDRE